MGHLVTAARPLLAAFAFALAAAGPAPAVAAPAPPRLTVVVVVDQLPAWQYRRLTPAFGDDGLGGLKARGAAELVVDFGHGATLTAPGHATLATGAGPPIHGVQSNHWHIGHQKIYAVDDPSSPVLGRGGQGRSAHRLEAVTVGGALKAATGGAAKVVGIALKDRASILSVGPAADLALWYDASLGRFTTSAAWALELPPWIRGPATVLPARSAADGRWPLPSDDPLRRQLAGPDDHPAEHPPPGWDRTFPHDLAGQPNAAGLYRAHPTSIGDLFDLALIAIDGFEMGRDEIPDLLFVGVSTTDYLGHAYGPRSLEVLGLMRHLDEELARFLDALDARLGRAFALALSSDHGIPTAPLRRSPPTGTIPKTALAAAAEAALSARHGPPTGDDRRVAGVSLNQVYLALHDVPPAERGAAAAAVAAALARVEGVAAAYVPGSPPVEPDPFYDLVMAGLAPDRHGQVILRPEPGWFVSKPGSPEGTRHGSPYAYDRQVPLILLHVPVSLPVGAHVDARALAPTLCRLLGVEAPATMATTPLPGAYAPKAHIRSVK